MYYPKYLLFGDGRLDVLHPNAIKERFDLVSQTRRLKWEVQFLVVVWIFVTDLKVVGLPPRGRHIGVTFRPDMTRLLSDFTPVPAFTCPTASL